MTISGALSGHGVELLLLVALLPLFDDTNPLPSSPGIECIGHGAAGDAGRAKTRNLLLLGQSLQVLLEQLGELVVHQSYT